jgi:hypothetical protein
LAVGDWCCREQLNCHREALEDYESVLKLESVNVEAQHKVETLQKALQQEGVTDAADVT